MRIHLLSDLHNEFDTFVPSALDADVVILAGDIDVKARGIAWAHDVFSSPVLYVPGNHEYYGGHLSRTLEKMRNRSSSRVQVLDRNVVMLGGVRFLGATAWTDFAATGNKPLASSTAQDVMNDYRQIRVGEKFRRIRPDDIAREAASARAWFRRELSAGTPGSTVIITHHAPLLRSLTESPHAASHLDAAYANDWGELISADRVALWVHGHSHTAADYHFNGTRIVCNPRGYPGESTGFDPRLIIEL